MRTQKKRALILAVVIGILCIFTCITGCSSNADTHVNVVNEENLSIPMFVEFEDDLLEDIEEDPAPNVIIGKANNKTMEVLKDCQKLILDYFAKYDIDVNPQIAALQNVYIFRSKYKSDDTSISGYQIPDTFDVYLNESILSDEDYLKFTYIHEVMHYLGFVDDETEMMQEGMADAIAEEILGYAYTQSYDIPRLLCHQLLIADPEILPYIINLSDLDDRIDNRLENVPREWYVKEHDLLLSDVLDTLLYQIEYADFYSLDSQTNESFVNQCQEIILAYCKTFGLTDEQMDEINYYII